MSFQIKVTPDLFYITDGSNTLTKNKDDIFCCVSNSNSNVVEIWETSPIESQRNLIFSSLYSNFSSPTGSTAALLLAEIIDAINFPQSVYTPTATAVTNIDPTSITVYPTLYSRDGCTICVGGVVRFAISATGAFELGLSIPVASNFTQTYDCNGTVGSQGHNEFPPSIIADVANNRAALVGSDNDATVHDHTFIFKYTVKP